MIRILLVVTAIAATTTPLASAPRPKVTKPNMPDAERLQGTWQIEVSEHNGKPYPKAVWTFAGEKMTSHSENGQEHSSWNIKLDPDKKHIDISKYPGIYAFDGDKLKIAYRLAGPRPTELSSAGDLYYCVLTRVKK